MSFSISDMHEHERSIDEQIRRAMEDGQFDNLPGKGKPLDLTTNPHEDPAWRLAFQALRSSGYTLPWIEKRQKIEADFDAACKSLERSWKWRESALTNMASRRSVDAEWKRAVDDFRERISKLNQRIFDYNLETPSEQFQRRQINIDREMERITGQ